MSDTRQSSARRLGHPAQQPRSKHSRRSPGQPAAAAMAVSCCMAAGRPPEQSCEFSRPQSTSSPHKTRSTLPSRQWRKTIGTSSGSG